MTPVRNICKKTAATSSSASINDLIVVIVKLKNNVDDTLFQLAALSTPTKMLLLFPRRLDFTLHG